MDTESIKEILNQLGIAAESALSSMSEAMWYDGLSNIFMGLFVFIGTYISFKIAKKHVEDDIGTVVIISILSFFGLMFIAFLLGNGFVKLMCPEGYTLYQILNSK